MDIVEGHASLVPETVAETDLALLRDVGLRVGQAEAVKPASLCVLVHDQQDLPGKSLFAMDSVLQQQGPQAGLFKMKIPGDESSFGNHGGRRRETAYKFRGQFRIGMVWRGDLAKRRCEPCAHR